MSNNCKNIKVDKSILLDEMINKQLKDILHKDKLPYKTMKRIVEYIDTSIFDDDKCCIWGGYITNDTPEKCHKGVYVNFYFKVKKVTLHRLLYTNFKDSLDKNHYLKFTCDNRGKCCNVNHMIKFKKRVKKNKVKDNNTDNNIKKELPKKTELVSNIVDEDNMTISFI
jgi:hypothetical protein